MLRPYITVDQVISIIFCSVPLWWWCPHFMFFFFLDKEATKALYTKTKKPFWWDVDRAHLSTVTLISKRLYQNGGEAFWQEWRERSVPGTSCLWLSGTRVFLFVFVFFFYSCQVQSQHACVCMQDKAVLRTLWSVFPPHADFHRALVELGFSRWKELPVKKWVLSRLLYCSRWSIFKVSSEKNHRQNPSINYYGKNKERTRLVPEVI